MDEIIIESFIEKYRSKVPCVKILTYLTMNLDLQGLYFN